MDTRVLYAAYGSNLLKERLMIYLTGGRIAGSAHDHEGARDTTPPRSAELIRVPYRMYFRRRSLRWHHGGAAFLDVDNKLGEGDIEKLSAYMRCYDVSLEQFNDIVKQENGDALPDFLAPEDIGRLREGGSLSSKIASEPHGWYQRMVFMGLSDSGLPILTFTCSAEEHLEHPPNPPSIQYAGVIYAGLCEAGVPCSFAAEYLTQTGGREFPMLALERERALYITG